MSTHYFAAYPESKEMLGVLLECLTSKHENRIFTVFGKGNLGHAGKAKMPVVLFGIDTMYPLQRFREEYGHPELSCKIDCHDDNPNVRGYDAIPSTEGETDAEYFQRASAMLFPN